MDLKTFQYSSIEVAKYLLVRAYRAGIPMNITKLQKLLYVAYGTYLAVRGERLTDESPKAWPYGPVFPRTRTEFLRLNFKKKPRFSDDPELDKISNDEDMKDLIDLVFRMFGKWTAGQLTVWSHGKDSPWEKTRTSFPGFEWGQFIPDEYIQEYFSTILVKRNDNKKVNQ